jgi:CheY-like chemotaxis protein
MSRASSTRTRRVHADEVRPRVLIVDDEPQLRKSLARALSRDAVVETAASMREALDHLRSGAQFDVILSDVMMPDGSGMDLHDAIKAEFPERVRGLVFMSGGISPALEARMALLSNRLIEKPVDVATLRALLSSLVREGRGSERVA